MGEKDWLALVVIYEEQNLTRAAERLYTSQPALTYRIQQIEANMGVKVFYRTKTGIKFTKEGKYLVNLAKQMLAKLQTARDYLKNTSNKMDGIIRLGVNSNFSHYKLPTILRGFLDLYPNVEFEVNTGISSDIYQKIYNKEVHIGILCGEFQWTEEKYLIEQEHLCIISKTPIDLKDLPKLPRIDFITDPPLVKNINSWWEANYDIPSNIIMTVDRVETCKQMVINRLGYAILSSISIKPEDGLYVIPLKTKDNQYVFRNTWMFYHKADLNFKVINKFIEFVKRMT